MESRRNKLRKRNRGSRSTHGPQGGSGRGCFSLSWVWGRGTLATVLGFQSVQGPLLPNLCSEAWLEADTMLPLGNGLQTLSVGQQDPGELSSLPHT